MNNFYPSFLKLNKLELNLRIGVSEEEREKPQKVLVFIRFYFPLLPTACNNDNLADTICYHRIAEEIFAYSLGKEFKLIEYLCFQLYKLLRTKINSDIKIWLKVKKNNPFRDDTLESTEFVYSDIYE